MASSPDHGREQPAGSSTSISSPVLSSDPEKSEQTTPGRSLSDVDLPPVVEKREEIPAAPADPNAPVQIKEEDCYDKLAYSWSPVKKYAFLSVIAGIQISMNFNTSVYPNAVIPVAEEYHVSEQVARVGQMIYLVLYSFGCELWAPWSEEFGRWPILQLSMFLINIWQIPAGLAPNFGALIVARGLVRAMNEPHPVAKLSVLTRLTRVASLPRVEVLRSVSSLISTSPRSSSGLLPSL